MKLFPKNKRGANSVKQKRSSEIPDDLFHSLSSEKKIRFYKQLHCPFTTIAGAPLPFA
jgi:hypothetical protein